MKGGGQEGLAYDDFWMVYFGKLRFTFRYTCIYIYITYMYIRWCVCVGLYVYILLCNDIILLSSSSAAAAAPFFAHVLSFIAHCCLIYRASFDSWLFVIYCL